MLIREYEGALAARLAVESLGWACFDEKRIGSIEHWHYEDKKTEARYKVRVQKIVSGPLKMSLFRAEASNENELAYARMAISLGGEAARHDKESVLREDESWRKMGDMDVDIDERDQSKLVRQLRVIIMEGMMKR